jgi:hypothetical protein
MSGRRARSAVVAGMIATYPVGGVVWDYGQYALGLERLGFDVYYLEDTGLATYDARGRRYVDDPAYGVQFLEHGLAALSATLARRWHFRSPAGACFGVDERDFAAIVRDADLLLNVSGSALLRDPYLRCRCKVLIDTDPGLNHFRNYPRMDANPTWGGGHGWRCHDHFFTYAERIGRADCMLPPLGIDWRATRPPVVLDRWSPRPPGSTWTTVMTWKNHAQTIRYEGVEYGTKEMEFERIESLPRRVSARLEIASGGTDRPDNEDEARSWYPTRPRWERLGWSVIDAHDVSGTPQAYRDYIEGSRGEFSVAKNVYVATRSGWFSCRSVCYLAAGRPAVVQDTGFSDIIPCGEGVLAFSSLDEAADALNRVEADYPRHQSAARRVAARHFASDRVLGDLLCAIGLGPKPA